MAKQKNKPIVELDKPNGKPMAYWESAKAAAEFYKLGNQVIITYNVKGITKQAKGHYFRYATPKEIAAYHTAMSRSQETISTEPTPVEPIKSIPVDIIPEVVEKADSQPDALSPFERMLQESKKKFNNNSE